MRRKLKYLGMLAVIGCFVMSTYTLISNKQEELTRTVNSEHVQTEKLDILPTKVLPESFQIITNLSTESDHHRYTSPTVDQLVPHELISPTNMSQSKPSASSQRPVQVIIITKMRSGSSFTGEIFNRNDEFVYYFEPLNEIPLDKKDTTASFQGTSRELILEEILKCNFSNFQRFNWWAGRRPRQQCSLSQSFARNPLCVRGKASMSGQSDAQKIRYNEEACKSRPNIAIKTVRIGDISTLKPMLTNPFLNVRIVHLVRDPRAVSNSRQDIHDPDNPTKSCEKMNTNLQYWLDPPDWIKGRYMLLRYEDLAENPEYTVNKVYEFLNLTTPSNVKRWMEDNTKHTARDGNKWGHTRDSSKTAHAWRTSLKIKFNKVLDTQRGCKNVMQLLGYKPVQSSAQLRDMQFSTLERFPYPLLPNKTA